jgi:predicted metal-dependent enzyme (double-stranded beta helix superfamily)
MTVTATHSVHDDRTAVRLDLSAVPGLTPLPARTLTRGELRRLVDELALRPELWRPLAGHDGGPRHYACLHRDSHVDVWVLSWRVVDDTGWHDHDTSSGAVAVVRGVVAEGRLRVDGADPTRRLAAGASIDFGPEHIHRMNGGQDGSVSIHAYSPPLWRMGQYTLSPDGVLERTSVSYADELRPV